MSISFKPLIDLMFDGTLFILSPLIFIDSNLGKSLNIEIFFLSLRLLLKLKSIPFKDLILVMHKGSTAKLFIHKDKYSKLSKPTNLHNSLSKLTSLLYPRFIFLRCFNLDIVTGIVLICVSETESSSRFLNK